jgi:hypothetical protein
LATTKQALKDSIKALKDADQRKANKDFQKETDKYLAKKKTHDDWMTDYNKLYAKVISGTATPDEEVDVGNKMKELQSR